jgi:protein phosphatase
MPKKKRHSGSYFTVSCAALTDPGIVRSGNEDAWVADTDQNLFIVSDGMGGENAGEIASAIVVRNLPGLFESRLSSFSSVTNKAVAASLEAAIADLSAMMHDFSQKRRGLSGMGATVVALAVHGKRVHIAHLGDSRAHLIRDGKMSRLTNDHSVVQLFVTAGEIRPEEVRLHPARGQLYKFMGVPADLALPDMKTLAVQRGDWILMCTDGLTDMVPDAALRRAVEDAGDPSALCAELVQAANDGGGVDNITVMALKFS